LAKPHQATIPFSMFQRHVDFDGRVACSRSRNLACSVSMEIAAFSLSVRQDLGEQPFGVTYNNSGGNTLILPSLGPIGSTSKPLAASFRNLS